jgi:hypothetical protein
MIAGASNARFRRPTVIWRTTPADSRRVIASLVAWKLRPMRSAALDTDTTGTPGSARTSSSVADPLRIVPTAARHSSWMHASCAFEGRGVIDGSATRTPLQTLFHHA